MRKNTRRHFSTIVLLAAAGWMALADPAMSAEKPKLAPAVMEFLARLRKSAPPKSPVDVMIAAVPGRHKAVAECVGELDGKVLHRVDEVVYMRVRIPVEMVEKLAEYSGRRPPSASLRPRQSWRPD
jgi:hypothetical protein